MTEKDVILPILSGGVPAVAIYALGRVAPGMAIVAAFIAALGLFLFIAMAGALGGGSPMMLLIACGPFVGLGAAIRHA